MIGRNDPCPCGSGKKYKKCCLPIEERVYRKTGSKNMLVPLQAFAEGNKVDHELAKAFYSTDFIDLRNWNVSELNLLINLTEISRSIDLCLSNKYFISTLKLIYSAIDNLAYLGTRKLSVSNSDFIKWDNLFLLPDSSLPCTAEELWASRCGLLHQNTVATCNLSSGTKKIFYAWGTANPEDGLKHVNSAGREQCRFVNINYLQNALKKGMLTFLKTISSNSQLKQSVIEKAEKYFCNIDKEAYTKYNPALIQASSNLSLKND